MFHVLHARVVCMQPSPWDDDDVKPNDSNPPPSIPLNAGNAAPQSSDSVPSMNDSVVGGNLHTGNVVNNHYHSGERTDGTQTAQQPMIMGAPVQQPFGQHPIMITQQPSSSAKVIGIFVIIFGALNILGELAGFLVPGAFKQPGVLVVASVLGLILSGVTIAGGVMMVNYQRRGLILVCLAILVSTIIQIGALQVAVDYDQMYENGDITEEEYDALNQIDDGGLITAIGTGLVVICNGVCLGIVAIPLMVSNNGLDNSKLFG